MLRLQAMFVATRSWLLYPYLETDINDIKKMSSAEIRNTNDG